MKVLVVSDTHGRIKNLERVLDKVKPIDLLLHLGDIGEGMPGSAGKSEISELAGCPVTAVSGNNDWLSRDPQERIIELGRHKALMTHGHRASVHYGTERIKELARQNGADIVLYGHTHVPDLDLSGDVWAINPGSLTLPRNGSGYSYVIFDIDAAGEIHPSMFSL